MSKMLSPILHARDLMKLQQEENLVLIDVSSGPNARLNYQKKHLDGALYVDLNTQLSDIKQDFSKGGRHPLPTLDQFSHILASLGITPQSHVVLYDDKNGANAAARFWWMLKSAGHAKVQVLDGGMKEAEKAGFPVNSKAEIPNQVDPYKIEEWKLPMADIAEVEKASQDDRYTVIDVRENERYKGETEPIDLVAGHIPGAINIPFTTNLNSEGVFLTPEELKMKYQQVLEKASPENVIVHCGSGVTACHTLLAMDYAGLEIPRLYVGSWSEWSRNDKPISKDAD